MNNPSASSLSASQVGAAISLAVILSCLVLGRLVGSSQPSGSGYQGAPVGPGSSGLSCSTSASGTTYSLDLISVTYPPGWTVDTGATQSNQLGLVDAHGSVFVVIDHMVSAGTTAAQLLSGIGDNIRNNSNLAGVHDMGPLLDVSVGGVPALGEGYTATEQGSTTPSELVILEVVAAVHGTTGVELFGMSNGYVSVPLCDYDQMYAGVVWK